MIVPFDRFGEMLAIYRERLRGARPRRAVWGHISDGNLHPNVHPAIVRRTSSAGKAAILAFGREVDRGSAAARSPSTASAAIPSSSSCCASSTATRHRGRCAP